MVLANHGSVVLGKDGEVGCNAIGKLEDTSRLVRGYDAWMLTDELIKDIVTTFDAEWDD